MKQREAGTVRDWDDEEGFGHLTGADGRVYWAHFSAIQGDGFRSLRPGQAVEFRSEGLSQGDVLRAEVVWPL